LRRQPTEQGTRDKTLDLFDFGLNQSIYQNFNVGIPVLLLIHHRVGYLQPLHCFQNSVAPTGYSARAPESMHSEIPDAGSRPEFKMPDYSGATSRSPNGMNSSLDDTGPINISPRERWSPEEQFSPTQPKRENTSTFEDLLGIPRGKGNIMMKHGKFVVVQRKQMKRLYSS
jgi:hypothetical protein